MKQRQPQTGRAKTHGRKPVLAGCALLLVLAGLAALLLLPSREPEPPRSDTDVPLGVEQAVIVRYSGPQLQARPYQRGASVNLRIADQVQNGRVRVYDVRYVVSLPGEFDVTEYLTSTDGRPIDDLPPFPVRGLTSLTKDIETRIQEIENAGVHIWHWYYELLAAAGVFWVAWLVGLIYIGRPKRVPKPPPAPPQPSIIEQIDGYIIAMTQRELTIAEKASLEALLLGHWRRQLGLAERRMAVSCRVIKESRELSGVYGKLQAWLHSPRAGVGPAEFLESYTLGAGNGVGNGEPRILGSAESS